MLNPPKNKDFKLAETGSFFVQKDEQDTDQAIKETAGWEAWEESDDDGSEE